MQEKLQTISQRSTTYKKRSNYVADDSYYPPRFPLNYIIVAD